jgi:hypothetical protein
MGVKIIFLTLAWSLTLSAATLNTSRSASFHRPFAATSLPKQTSADIPQPKVSAIFQDEINRLAAEGLRLKEATGADLEATAHHLAAIFERTKSKESGGGYEFRIIESDGAKSKTIFTRKDFFFSFAALEDMEKFNATDINGDGLKEILVQSSSGGNCWACNPVEIYQIKNHQVNLIAAAPIQQIVDLNGDGLVELIVADARWEFYGDLSHAASPSAKLVYAWRSGRFINASRDFAEFYKAEIERLRKALDEVKASITAENGSDDSYIGLAITLAISYRHAGEIERGLKEFEALMNANTRSPQQAKRRALIIRDFRIGDSADKFLQVKYGDPLIE